MLSKHARGNWAFGGRKSDTCRAASCCSSLSAPGAGVAIGAHNRKQRVKHVPASMLAELQWGSSHVVIAAPSPVTARVCTVCTQHRAHLIQPYD